MATYGYCAWCDGPIGNLNKLWRHYLDSHQVLMQVAPMTPPSVWQTLVVREMGARTSHFPQAGSSSIGCHRWYRRALIPMSLALLKEDLRCALAARQATDYIDCSTCPERLILDYLWLDRGPFLADSQKLTNPFCWSVDLC